MINHTGDSKNLISEAIENAQEIVDPLDGLIERTATDSGAPFKPEVLQRLAELKEDDPAGFDALRAGLRKIGCRVTALDDAIPRKSSDANGRAPKQADVLINLAGSAELFHTPDKAGFADLQVNGHRET